MHGFFTRTADPYLLAVFRIVSALVGIGYLSTYAWHVDFAWAPYSQPAKTRAICVCCGLIALLIVRLFGFGGTLGDRISSVLHFLGATWLLSHTFPYVTVNEELYLMLAFWCCFIPLNTKWSLSGTNDLPPPKEWPLYGLGMNIGTYFFTAGLDKLHDPFWSDGTGYYHAFLLPWIRPAWTGAALNWTTLTYLMNHVSIVLELMILPLFLIRQTRWLACGCLAAFFCGLMFPFRIDWIGEVGLLIPLALIASSPLAARLFSRLRQDRVPLNVSPPVEQHTTTWFPCLLLITIGLLSIRAILIIPLRTSSPNPVLLKLYTLLDSIYSKPLHYLVMHTVYICPKTLFTQSHTIGIWEYRVEVECDDGQKFEPFPVFLPDKTAGPFCGEIGVPRYYQACIYPISAMCKQLSTDVSPSLIDSSVADRLLLHGLSRARRMGKTPVKSRLLVSPIVVPRQNMGHVTPWTAIPWITIREFDVAKQKGQFTSRPPEYPLFAE